MNVGEFGVPFVFSTGYDMSDFTAISIDFIKPDGTTLTATNPDITVPAVVIVTTLGRFEANEYVHYNFKDGDVDQKGIWSARVIYDNTNATPPLHLISDLATFTVNQ